MNGDARRWRWLTCATAHEVLAGVHGCRERRPMTWVGFAEKRRFSGIIGWWGCARAGLPVVNLSRLKGQNMRVRELPGATALSVSIGVLRRRADATFWRRRASTLESPKVEYEEGKPCRGPHVFRLIPYFGFRSSQITWIG